MTALRLIEDLIERQPIGRLQRLVVTTLFLIMLLDGLDLQLLAYAAPVITGEWHVTRLQLAPALSATLVGTACGALIGGALGDRIGRRWALIGTVALFGAGTLLCARAGNVTELAACRFLSGMGFGACFPSAVALTAEWLPKRSLSKATGLIQVGVPTGAMIGALLSGTIIPALGWRVSFLAGGVLPLILAAAMLHWLPESPEWLSRSPAKFGRVLQALANAWPGVGLPDAIELGDGAGAARKPAPGGYRQVIFDMAWRTNLGVWLGFFANGLAAYAFWSWGTTVLTAADLSLADALRGAFLYALAGLVATFPAAYLAARFGTRPIMLILSIAGVLVMTAIYVILSATPAGQVASIRTPLFVGFFLGGACLSGLQGLLYVIGAQAYPTECRASGVGLGATTGRVGGIISALAGGALLSLFPPALFFLAAAAMIAGVVVATLVFDRHRPGESRRPGWARLDGGSVAAVESGVEAR